MKKLLVIAVFVLSGCSLFASEDLGNETSQLVDDGQASVWYEDYNYNISLRLPDLMEGYESTVVGVSEADVYGTLERVEFSIDGGVVATLNVHERSEVEINLDSFEYAAESDESQYLFTFATTLSGESELQSQLMDMSFNLDDFITFE